VRYARVEAGDPAALARVVRTHGAGALLIAGAVAERPTVELLEDVACPVVLLR
jgi:DUF1009 family protein